MKKFKISLTILITLALILLAFCRKDVNTCEGLNELPEYGYIFKKINSGRVKYEYDRLNKNLYAVTSCSEDQYMSMNDALNVDCRLYDKLEDLDESEVQSDNLYFPVNSPVYVSYYPIPEKGRKSLRSYYVKSSNKLNALYIQIF